MTAILDTPPVLSRREVACHELEAAIRHLFLSEELVTAHLLAWAALDVISDVGKARGSVTLRGSMVEKMPVEMRSAWRKAERDHYNFMKHADRDPDSKIRLIPDMTLFAIYVACRDYLAVFSGRTAIMAIYCGWYISQNPEMGASFDLEYRAMLPEVFGQSPHDAWAEVKKMLEVAAKDPEFTAQRISSA